MSLNQKRLQERRRWRRLGFSEEPLLLSQRDLEEVERGFEQRKLVDALGGFLSGFHWQLYGTPTFKYPVSFPVAERRVVEWVSGFGPQTYAYAAYEKGYAGGRTHLHLLLGGLTTKLARAKAGCLWKAGRIQIEPFDPKRGACWYVSKFPNDGDFIGRPLPHKKRRGRRGKNNSRRTM